MDTVGKDDTAKPKSREEEEKEIKINTYIKNEEIK